MRKLMLSVVVFMFVFGSSIVAVAQDPVKKDKPTTEQTEKKKECPDKKGTDSKGKAKGEVKNDTIPAAEKNVKKGQTESPASQNKPAEKK